jgi:hypothetical protein
MNLLTKKRIVYWHNLEFIPISIIAFATFEALVYINNLYQPIIYLQLSGFIYLFWVIWAYYIFDLHYKGQPTEMKNIFKAIAQRFHYFGNWQHFRSFQNYLILPGIIFWGSIVVIGINFGHNRLQQFIAIASSICLIISFALFKEIFRNKKFPVQNAHFIILSYVKLYAAWLIYSASLGIVWFYCFPAHVYYMVIFLVTFMLLYQALFQCIQIKLKHLLHVFLISLVLALSAVVVYNFWNVNYFSAGLFLLGIYNLLWGFLFHSHNKTLSKEIIFEQLAIFALIMVMVFGTTNFHSKILRCI